MFEVVIRSTTVRPVGTGHDFLTVLGAHEGEGVVVAADAQVAGSSSPHMADKVGVNCCGVHTGKYLTSVIAWIH